MTEKPASYPAKMNRGMAQRGTLVAASAASCLSKAIVGIVRSGKRGPSQPLKWSSHPSFHLWWDVGFPPEKRLVRAVRHPDKSG